ncbi:hypothetical protein V6N13_088069 [Hibiscus sabdariffa]
MSGPTLEVENIFSYMVQLELVQCNDFYPRRDTKHVGTNSGEYESNGIAIRKSNFSRLIVGDAMRHSDRNGGNLNILLKLLTFSVTGLA